MVRGVGIALVLMATQAVGQWKEGATPVADEGWRKSDRGFGAMLFLTDDFAGFKAEWRKPGTPQIREQDLAVRGKELTAVVLFSGCKAKDGRCSVRVDWRVLRPDGSEYAALADTAAWPSREAAPEGVVVVSDARLGLVIEPEDPAGKYLVRARVRDGNSGVAVSLERPFTVGR